MPEKIVLQDGTEREVMTDDEIQNLKAGHDANIEKKEKLAQLEAELEETKKKYESDVNPNWQEAREKMRRLEEINKKLQEQGKTINDAGEIVDSTAPSVNLEDVQRTATEAATKAAREQLISERIESALSQYDKEQKEVIGHYFKKLSAGEDLNLSNVDKFIGEAARLASPSQQAPMINVPFTGAPPITETGKEDFSEKPEGKDLAERMNLPFTQTNK